MLKSAPFLHAAVDTELLLGRVEPFSKIGNFLVLTTLNETVLKIMNADMMLNALCRES